MSSVGLSLGAERGDSCAQNYRDGRWVISFCSSHLTVHKKTLSERREATDERKWMVLWGGIKNSK